MKSPITKSAILIAALFAFSAPLFAQTIVVPEFKVDNNAPGKNSLNTAIEYLGNGTFVVVWADDRNADAQIFASIYDSNGNVLRDDYRIDDGVAGSMSLNTGPGAITSDSNGNFFVAYLNSVDGGTTYTGRIRKFLPNGDPAGPSVGISDFPNLSTQLISIASGSNGKIIATYIYGSTYYRIFDNDLNILVPNGIASQTPSAFSGSAVASDAIGNTVFVWSQNDGGMLDGMMRARLYDPDGNPRTNEFVIEPYVTGGQDPQVIYNKDGHFCVVWFFALYWAYGRVFDGDGNPLTDLFDLGPEWFEDNEAIDGPPSVDSDSAGNFVIVYPYWSDFTPTGLYGSILSSNGNFMARHFPISSRAYAGSLIPADVACINKGDFVATWQDRQDDWPNFDVWATIIHSQPWDIVTPVAGPGVLALIAAGLGWALRRRLKN